MKIPAVYLIAVTVRLNAATDELISIWSLIPNLVATIELAKDRY